MAATREKKAADRHASWTAPEWPRCAEICHPTATVCESCGAHLYPPTQRSAA